MEFSREKMKQIRHLMFLPALISVMLIIGLAAVTVVLQVHIGTKGTLGRPGQAGIL